MIIDFRSDTVTKPTAGMLDTMKNAKVGDDVFGEDPSINELEETTATLFNMESALFCPSGTMTNQIAIKCHTHPGDEVICDESSHVYQYEAGGIAFHSGASVKLLFGNRGRINAIQVANAINPDDLHKANSSLVSLENTNNRGGGSCYDFQELADIKKVCKENNLKLHLDGARLFNAMIAKNETPEQYGQLFNSISVCLSKGLGCPVGSLLLGNKDFIKKARKLRKAFGGAMRQGGFLAAAGIYALQNHVERLKEDHQHATQLSEILKTKSFIKEIFPVETNIIIFELLDSMPAAALVNKLKEYDILCFAVAPNQLRMVLHLDITKEMVERTCTIIQDL